MRSVTIPGRLPRLGRLIVLVVILSGSLPVKGQQFSQKVHQVPQVQVIANRNDYYNQDQKIMVLDTTTLAQYSTDNLGELLSKAGPIFIRSYGAQGSVSAPSFRGTPAQHTSVTWNGFPINSMTLGQCDLSLSPASFTDQVTITHSAPSSLYGSGTFGGAIAMENQPDWDQRQSLGITAKMGSWNNQRYGLQTRLGNAKFHYRLKGFYQKAQNNYEYRDYQQFGQPVRERKNNAVQNVGVMQNVYYQHSTRSRLEAGVWFQNRNKEVPDIMGASGQSHAQQKDSTLRAYASWKRTFDHSALQVKSGFFYHYQLYKEKESAGDQNYMIHSPLETQKWMNDLNYRYYLNQQITFDAGFQYSNIRADVKAYNRHIGEYRMSAIGAFQYETDQLTANVSLRQQFNSYTQPAPQYSIGVNYRPWDDQLFIRGHFSTKYRLPTLNDKYWQPGGNKDLKPEHGWSGEMAAGYTLEYGAPGAQSTIEVTAYQSNIHDMIEWIPKEGASFWHPVNTSKVRTTGLEVSMKHRFQLERLQMSLSSIYHYTRAMNLNKDQPQFYRNQLRYTPYHNLKNILRLSFKHYQMNTSLRYTGIRYAGLDNATSNMLDDYFVVDLGLSRNFKFTPMKGSLKFQVKNLLDRQYQVIANYPMPGQAFYIHLNIQFNQLFKQI